MDESSMDAFASVQVCPSTPRPIAIMAAPDQSLAIHRRLGLRRLGSSSGGDVEDGAVDCPEGPSDLDRPSVKERTARRKLPRVLPTTTGDGIGRSRRDELHHLANLGPARFGWFLLPLGKSWSRIPAARVRFIDTESPP
jgi:hypothetical protein